jgi:MFS transporter, DHA1 family, multidrug resistance protein
MWLVSIFSAGRRASSIDAERRRNLLAVSLAAFLASVGFMVVMPLLPGLIREVVGPDVESAGLWLGLAIGVSPLLTALSGPFWGALGDRYGHKVMIQRSLLCIGVGIGLLALAQSPVHVVALRALIGGLGGVSVAALAAVTATTPRRDLGPAVGTLQASQTAGTMVGPLLGGALGGLLGMREAFLVSAAVFGSALVLVAWLYRERGGVVATAPRETRGPRRTGGPVEPGVLVALLVAWVASFVEAGFIVLLPLQLERLGAAPESLPWVFGLGLSAAGLAATVTAAVGGRLARTRSAMRLLCGVLVLGLAALAPLALAQTWWQFLGLRVLLALLVGAAPTLAYSAAATLAPPERRGRTVGLVSSAGVFGWATSPLVAGAFVQHNPTLLLAVDGILYALGAVLLLAVERGLLARPGPARMSRPHLPTLLPNVGGARGLLGRLASPARPHPHRRVGKPFSPEEVVAALRGRLVGERADAILEAVARPAEWMPADPRQAFGDLPRYGERLPTILHLYRRGEDAEAIGRRLSLFGGAWPVERTVNIAARLIADRLNR